MFFTAMLALLWCVLIVTVPFGNVLITTLFSGDFVAAGGLLPFLASGMVLYVTAFYLLSAWNARTRNHATSLIMLAGLLINIGLCLVLIPRHGLLGAAIAVCCAHGAVCVAAVLLAMAKMPSFSLSPLRSLYISICGFALLLALGRAGSVETFTSRSALLALGVVVLYALLVAPVTLPRILRGTRVSSRR
jgi:O-antigen/teichoic acid export membrane protein